MRLLLHWDPEIEGEFRRAFERALSDLAIEHDDASSIDETPSGSVTVALASPASAREKPKDALLIVGGPGEAQANGALRIETKDIAEGSRRWAGVVEKLAAALDRRALVPYVAAGGDVDTLKRWALEHPADPLADSVRAEFDVGDLRARLADAARRAEAAEAQLRRTGIDKHRAEGEAIDARRAAEDSAVLLRAQLDAAHERIRELNATLDATGYALADAPEGSREIIAAARREAGLARIAADRAEAVALDAPDSLRWHGAHYLGETRNGLPHGLGVMTFASGGKDIGGYRGQFEAGKRAGLGVGISGGFAWTGRWAEDEAFGPGVLETPEGRRFEGEVASVDGVPRKGRGHVWRSARAPLLRHTPAPANRQLPPA